MMSDNLVILLHGVGSSGADIAGLAPALAPTLPNTKFVSPDGPGRFNAGHQWFCITGVTPENRPARVAAARPSFDAILSDLIGREGFAGRLDRVALVGFSQGSIMALDALASGRWPVAGVVAFSGRLASPEPLEPVKGSKLLLFHGADDQMMPVPKRRPPKRNSPDWASPRAVSSSRASGTRCRQRVSPKPPSS